MKTFIIIGLCCLAVSCGGSGTYNRGYVISKAQVDSEAEAPAEN